MAVTPVLAQKPTQMLGLEDRTDGTNLLKICGFHHPIIIYNSHCSIVHGCETLVTLALPLGTRESGGLNGAAHPGAE